MTDSQTILFSLNQSLLYGVNALEERKKEGLFNGKRLGLYMLAAWQAYKRRVMQWKVTRTIHVAA